MAGTSGSNPNPPGGTNPTPAATPAAQQPAADPAAQQQNTPQQNTQPTTQNFTPNETTGVEVRAVNPPLTPDQVVGLYDTPVATPKLPTLKLENIKTPNIKNKTIQGYLKAIEAKMLSTEKLMKDIIKLQNVQIITEKEVNLRKRELYSNTFQEYLLDKTIDFGKKKKDCVCINLPENTPQTAAGAPGAPTSTPTPSPTGTQSPTTTTTDKPANKPANKPTAPIKPTTPTTTKPSFNPLNPATWPSWVPGSKPPTANPKSSPAPPHIPGQRPKTPPSVPSPRGPKAPPHRIPSPVIDPVVPIPGEPGVQPIEPYKDTSNNIVRGRTSVSTGANYRAGLPVGGTLSGLGMVAGPMVTALIDQQRVSQEIQRLQKLKSANPTSYNDEIWRLRNDLTTQIEKVTSPITGSYNYSILQGLGESRPEDKPYLDRLTNKASGGIQTLSHFLPQSTVMGYIENAPQANGGVTIPDPVTTLTRDVRTAAGGGMKDLELYNTDSLNYFRNMSSTIMTKAAGGGVFDIFKMFTKPKGLTIKGVQAGFTGMAKQGFDAIMGGDKFRLGRWKPQILGRGAYSAPTIKGAQRYAGSQGSLGGGQTPGGVVKSIVPGGARRINFLEPQAAVKPGTFDKGKLLADKLLQGAYANSPLANQLRMQLMSGTAQNIGIGLGKTFGKALGALNAPVIGDMLFPEPTAQYDQLTGPNSFRNNPAYKKLETTQGNLTSRTNNKPTVVPLPPEYINIPGRRTNRERDMSTIAPPPGVKDMPSSIFRKDMGVYR
jgi:hypothetical protein